MTSEVQPSDSWEPKDGYQTLQAGSRAVVQVLNAIHLRHRREIENAGLMWMGVP